MTGKTTSWRTTLLIALLAAARLSAAPEWEDETVTDLNTEPPHATLATFATRDEALGDSSKSTRAQSLSGRWKFNLARRPEQRPVNFFEPSFDVSAWSDISVPGNWQMQGFGRVVVLNIQYPFVNDPPRVMGEPPKNWVAYENRNEIGSYRRDFEIPADWAGQEVFLHFAGVESAMYVWINGQRVGYSEDSYTPAEFRITPHLNPGRNTVAVEVYRWSDGNYLEDQDFIRLSGIFRDVSLYATPQTYLQDLKAEPSLDTAFENGTLKVLAKLRNVSPQAAARRVEIELIDVAGRVVSSHEKNVEVAAASEATVDFNEPIDHPAHWTAETPSLYTLLTTLKDRDGRTLSVDRTRVGFRNIEIRDGVFLINGRPVKLHGVNRHETDPDTGRTVSEAAMLRDILLLKRLNIDTVRTSHYPNCTRWYELCDEYGIYIVDEANVESHGMGYGRDSLSRKPSWRKAHVERAEAMVHRDKNHPCVILWSYGNEAGPGENFAASRDAVKAIDQTRPTHYEGNSDYADIRSEMYTGHDRVRDYGQRKSVKPFFLCEYSHAQGNAEGGLAAYWDILDSSPQLMGGCIWDFADQALRRKAADGQRSPDGKEFYFAYGGDFDNDQPNDGLTVCDGIVDPDRTIGAKAAEVRRVYQPARFAADGKDSTGRTVAITNRFSFRSLDGLTLEWSVTSDGEVIQRGTMAAPAVKPGETESIPLPIETIDAPAGRRVFVNVSLRLASPTTWASVGHELAAGQWMLPIEKPASAVAMDGMASLQMTADEGRVTITGSNFEAGFDLTAGTLDRLTAGGVEILASGPQPQVFRAPGDNDVWINEVWRRLGLVKLRRISVSPAVERLSDSVVRVRFKREWAAEESVGFSEDTTYTVLGDGTIDVSVQFACTRESLVLPREGVRLSLRPGVDRLTWFGRGPMASYPDRIAAAAFGRFSSSVAEQYEPFVRPQTMGNHADTQWLTLTDEQGHGLLVSTPTSFAFSALHFTEEDLDGPRHPTELTPRAETVLSLDCATLGLGSASCGPRTLPQYQVHAAPHVLHYRLRALDGATADSAALARRDYPIVAPVEVARDSHGFVTLACATPDAALSYSVDDGPPRAYSGPFECKAAATITARATATNMLASPASSRRFGRWLDRSLWRATADSFEPGEGDIAYAIDDDPSTFWHTRYTGDVAQLPHELTLDLGAVIAISAVTYLPRQDTDNGRAAKYQVRISDDGEQWTTVADAKFPNDGTLQSINVSPGTHARFVKFVVLAEVHGRQFATVAELGVTPN